MTLRYGSLCTGVGGLDLAVESVFNAKMAWYAETDRNACTVLVRHWPGVPNLGDLTAADWTSAERVDLICAGFPCQPFSVAGKQKGWKDDRAIWPNIADCIRVLRPGLVVLENVPGFIRLGLGRILSDLTELGFDAEWTTVCASDIGACHRRKRLFLVAYSRSSRYGAHLPAALSPDGEAGLRLDQDKFDGCPGPALAPDSARVGPVRRRPPTRGRGTGLADDGSFPWGRYGPAIQRHEQAFGRPAPWPVIEDSRSLSGDFTEWMMGFPAGWLDGVSNTAKKKLAGNAVVTRQAEVALRELAAKRLAQGVGAA